MGRPPGRPARVTETRAAESRQNERRYVPQSRHVGKLYIPKDEIPNGYTYSWVDVGLVEPNFQRADEQAAKGWTPVPRSRHPQFARGGSLIPGRADSDPYATFIRVGGSLLCERPTSDVDMDKAVQMAATNEQVKSISRWRNGEGADPLMPRIDDSSEPQRAYAASFKKD